MPRQRTNYFRETRDFTEDFPQRLERFKEESGLTWAEIACRIGTCSKPVALGKKRHLVASGGAGELLVVSAESPPGTSPVPVESFGIGMTRQGEARDMKHRQSPGRVILNPVAVWELLDQLEISQNQLARLAGISPGHLSLLMNGKRSPAPKVRRRLMRALGVDDFHRLFIIVPPAAADGNAGRANSPKRKKGGIQGQSE